MYQRSEQGFGLAGATVALSLDQAIDYVPSKPKVSDRFKNISNTLSDIDWVPDLGTDIGSLNWFRGLFTCALLCGSAYAITPTFAPIPAAVPAPLSDNAWEETRAQSIAPLAWGGDTGRHMGSNDLVVSLNNTPERPAIDITASLGDGDGFTRVLERNGVGSAEAHKVASMVSGVASLDGIEPGTVMNMTLGQRPSREVARPLQSLDFRANFGMRLSVRRVNGGLVLDRHPIAIDRTPLRIVGTVADGFYRSARAAGVPASAVESFLRAVSGKISIGNDLGSGARFDVIVEQAKAATGEVQNGKMLYAGVSSNGRAVRMIPWTIDGRTEWYEASGVGQTRPGMAAPVEGSRITSGFGMRFHPILGYSRFHKGIDFGAVTGTPVHAVTDGLVAFAGRNAGYGNHIRLSHSGVLGSSYSHLSRILVAPGSRVAQGQIIGYVGSTGLSTGPHLHFEVYKSGIAVDPRAVNFQSRSLLSGPALAAFRDRLNSLLSIPISGQTQIASSQ